jgi:tetratricopeptide (TPR) repeat protein
MKNPKRNIFRVFSAGLAFALFSLAVSAQQVKLADYDITDYKMNVEILPDENKLNATVDVFFTPKEQTRSVTFELNGSIKVDSITRISAGSSDSAPPPTVPTGKGKAPAPVKTNFPEVTFVQDQVGVSDIGPSVRVDLGDMVAADTPVGLRFKYSGILTTPQGGPLLTKRLAFVGSRDGYLMYAARWFPFHDYAADRATSDITVTIPSGFQVIAYSDAPVVNTGGKYRFVRTKPGLVGNIAYGKYTHKTLRYADFEIQFYTKTPEDQLVSLYGETIGKALEFYTRQYGTPDMGKKISVVHIDDESLDFYSQQGLIYISDRQFRQAREVTQERLQREVAYQWWGLTVGLKSFDDAWLSQGLAEYSAYSLREAGLSGAQLDELRRELLEKSLTFEQTASLARTPATLDDQSTAYQYIMFAKGAFVYKLLRTTLGDQKFNQLLRTFLDKYRGKNASIDDFEQLTSQVAGENMRYFFARWVEGTGVPEFDVEYQIIRTRDGKFITRGTIKENYDNLRLPVELKLIAEGEGELAEVTVNIEDSSANFSIESNGKPIGVIVDPNYKLLRISDELKISSVARRGIEQFKEGNYAEAQQQFEAALKLDRSNAWIYYHLGLLFLEQRNYDLAIDNFKVVENLGRQGAARPAWLTVWSAIKMGNAYDAKGDRTRAVAAYKRAEDLGDNYDNAQEAVKLYLGTPYDPRKQSTTAVK